MRRLAIGVLILCGVALAAAPVFAQGSTTGSVNGTVSDNTGAVVPGVTVTVSGPALMGSQTAVTNDQGQYRFPTLPPGTYRLNYQLQGFNTIVREGIVVNVGFTATVNVQLALASIAETVTVSGASPVVDVQNTNVQNNFNAEMLKSIPNARDIWALIAVTPGATVNRFDVGGSRAGTQTGYQAYGLSGQIRMQIDGTNSTEETGGSPYVDYGALDEVSIGTDSNDASMPTPGVQINAVLKSGGNTLRGEMYFDYENENFQARNVTDALRRVGVGEGSRITYYHDANFNVGGPFKRDKFWYFVSTRSNRVGTTVTGFPVDNPSRFQFLSRLSHLTYKQTYQLNQDNRISQWAQVRQKLQPSRSASSSLFRDAVFKQNSMSAYGGADWHSIVSPTFFFNVRFGTWGYNWPNVPYGVDGELNENLRHRMVQRTTNITAGAGFADRTYRRRYQVEWLGVLYKDDWLGGSHAMKMGYVAEREVERNRDDGYVDEIRLWFNTPSADPFALPWRVDLYNTPVSYKDALWHHGAYLHDQISAGSRLTINAGLRWDYYRAYHPDQEIAGGRFHDFFYAGAVLPNGFSLAPLFSEFRVAAFDTVEYKAAFGPRVGVAYDLFGTGKTVLKGNWGRYYHNPGPISDNNPIRTISHRFNWNDRNNDRLFTLDELGTFVSSSGGTANPTDPNIGHPYTDDMSVWAEREIVPNLSARAGFIYKKQNNLYQYFELNRVGALYTLPTQFNDPGRDGVLNTADDGRPFTVFDIPAGVPLPPSRELFQTPDENDQDFKSIEFTVNKRMSQRWSLVASFHHTWAHTTLFGKPENPNQAIYNEHNFTDWTFKLFGTYRAPYGVNVSPLVRHQSGDPLSRIVEAPLRSGDFNYRVEPVGAYRVDNITLFDLRAEKRFGLPGAHEVGLFFDAFNITNSNAAESRDAVTGTRTATVRGERHTYPQFFRPSVILNPRIYRVGFKYLF